MALVRCVNNRIALISKECITIYEISDKAPSTHRLEIPQESLIVNQEEAKKQTGEADELGFSCANFSPCSSQFLAITRNKDLLVWKRNDSGIWELFLRRKLARKCVQVQEVGERVLVADRSGDVYGLHLMEPGEELLLGRLSMALDLVVSSDEKYLIVCDRDEKIQVSHFPNCYSIAAFCLGHTQFVSSMTLIPDHPDQLLSGSGDGSVRLWRYVDGTCLACVALTPLLEQKDPPAVLKLCCHGTTVACLLEKVSQVLVLKVEAKAVSLVQKVSVGSSPWDATWDERGRLWLVTPHHSSQPVQVFEPTARGLCPWDGGEILLQMAEACMSLRECQPQDRSHLYKQWFDNVEGYMKKKREREEGRAARKRARLD
ncbi:tRNA (guanine-N(7)-)-methyltransferase non-catalytic subunit WDR4-like [Ornithodoros turicata]|uniref:tRNA (guanine-N(7)-)-methyltransferase non-catalytic subunit WDR4-like n=1 Tax=Ornithodoros turicata TaxID=34597 RepID=UPI00313A2692